MVQAYQMLYKCKPNTKFESPLEHNAHPELDATEFLIKVLGRALEKDPDLQPKTIGTYKNTNHTSSQENKGSKTASTNKVRGRESELAPERWTLREINHNNTHNLY